MLSKVFFQLGIRPKIEVLFSVQKSWNNSSWSYEKEVNGQSQSMETPCKISRKTIVRIIPKVTRPLGLIIPRAFVGSW